MLRPHAWNFSHRQGKIRFPGVGPGCAIPSRPRIDVFCPSLCLVSTPFHVLRFLSTLLET